MTDRAPAESSAWPQSLIDVLEFQQALVDRLATLAEQQASLIESERTDALLAVLTQRQRVIDELTASQTRLAEITATIPAGDESMPVEQRHRIQALVDDVSERLQVVMQRDEQDQSNLQIKRDQVKADIGEAGAARQARHAYLGSRHVPNRFADQRG